MTIKNLYPSIAPSLNLDFAGTEVLDPRVTFARASTATYYDGVSVAKAEENLLLQSQNFSSDSWISAGIASWTGGATAPDGTTTAFTIDEGSNTNVHATWRQNVVEASKTYGFSFFAKDVNAQYVGCAINNSNGTYATVEFDLSGSGAVNRTATSGTGFVVVSSAITPVGNGWFRCQAVITTGSGTVSEGRAAIYMSDGATSFESRGRVNYTGTNRTFEVWGAQLEQRSAVTAYTPTTTQPITNYIPVLKTAAANVARFDHNPTTSESLGLLIEEQRTNLLERSEEFDNAAWVKTRASVTANAAIAPDGSMTADKLVEDTTASNTHRIATATGISFTSGTPYTYSIIAKAAERNWIGIDLHFQNSGSVWGASAPRAFFNLADGSVGTTQNCTTSVQPLGDGWYRCSLTSSAASSGTNNPGFRVAESDNLDLYTGDGYSGLFIWGAQLEAGAFPTSYIPTVASQVTRSADVAVMTGDNFSNWYRQDEGTLFAEYTERAFSATHQVLYASSGVSTERTAININASNVLDVQVVSSGTDTFGGNTPTLTAQNYKVAFAYKANDAGVSVNGSAVSTDTSVTLPVGVSRMDIGSTVTATQFVNSTIKRIAYYPKRLANAELQALTQV